MNRQETALLPQQSDTREACRMCGGITRPAATVRGYDFLECTGCSFVFAPRLTTRVLEGLYEEGFHGPEEGAPEEGWSLAEPAFLAPALDRLGDAPLFILDFGTGQSTTPDALRSAGHRVIAVDVAPPLRAHPDRWTGNVFDLPLPRNAFDLVYAFQVLEHVPEPAPVLKRLLDLTRPGGLVLVHTDMETPERIEGNFTGWWYVLPPDHCAFYRHRTFEVFVEPTSHEVAWRDAKRVVIEKGKT